MYPCSTLRVCPNRLITVHIQEITRETADFKFIIPIVGALGWQKRKENIRQKAILSVGDAEF